MYYIYVESFSDIKPRTFSVDFERPPGSLLFTVVVLAMCPRHEVEQVFMMFPGFRSTSFQSQVHEVAFVDIDWQVGRTFVIKRKTRPPMLLMDLYVRQKPPAGGLREGSQDERHAGLGKAFRRRD